ncbi:MAG: hypothetical protein K9M56_09920 [Victivallales bacterium]|nr:hypothetical protein [Victivallales bacterium]
MSELENKIEKIENKLELQVKKSKKTLKITFIVYLVIAVFVIVYTSYITSSFKSLATPDTVAELLVTHAEKSIPKINKYLKNNADDITKKLADRTVDYTRSLIPSLGLVVKTQLDGITKSVNKEFNNKYLPIIDEYFKQHKTKIKDNINNLSNEQTAKILANELMNQINFELVNVNREFSSSILKFKKQVNELAYTPNNQLTKKELAHKKVVAYWMYLLKHAEIGKLNL